MPEDGITAIEVAVLSARLKVEVYPPALYGGIRTEVK
jgi:hypothetical protein